MKDKRKGEFESIKEVLDTFIHEGQLEKGLDKIAIEEAWLEVMGRGVHGYTQRIQFKKGTLLVQLRSSVLREELSYGKEKIVTMLNKKLEKPLINTLKLL